MDYNKKDAALNQCVEQFHELKERLKESEDKINAIMNIIDLRIEENRQLAIIHFRTPEDDYINEYESRAYELEQLKKMIQNDK